MRRLIPDTRRETTMSSFLDSSKIREAGEVHALSKKNVIFEILVVNQQCKTDNEAVTTLNLI